MYSGTDWFKRLTGFAEGGYMQTRGQLEVQGERLRSLVNGRTFGVGRFELVGLAELRARVAAGGPLAGTLRVSQVSGDAGDLHREKALAGALFQVASQFNVLEMTGPSVTPEDGVTGYQYDHTQGPACAIAAGAGTIYRNYFVPVDGESGQTATRQIDALAPLGAALGRALSLPVENLWTMRNGYALATREGLDAIGAHLATLDESQRTALRGQLQIGLHWDVEVTSADTPGVLVSQAFCSALPVAYSPHPPEAWASFAQLVLEASYEATIWAALLNARRGVSPTVLLTSLGGGAFGNDSAWIEGALDRALTLAQCFDLDVRLVSYRAPAPAMLAVERHVLERAQVPAVRTSFTHPLEIAELPVGAQGGAIGVTFAPGKKDRAWTGSWARDLDLDLAAVRAWGATHLVTLVERHELEILSIRALPGLVGKHGLTWHHLPITDVSIPDDRFLGPWPAVSALLIERLQRGERVVVHCRGGLGRAGTVASMLLIDSGTVDNAQEAVRRVRAARAPYAIERVQEAWLQTYRPAR
jgi:protein-tyrosine phosphatase